MEDSFLTPIQARNGLEHDDLTQGQSRPELSAGNVKDKNVAERPTKRQKRTPLDDASESSSTEIVTEDGKPKPSKSIKAQAMNPNLINLAGTSDGHYVIAVTDEDKCVRVLRLDVDGMLQQLSKRNQKTLQHQKSLTKRKPRKNVATFEHKLLLGHVSLLTDVACVSVSDPGNTDAQKRTYIITADRDEHIRVSRGIPQSHVIEGFCLGHNQFVSQLCVPSWDKRILISGGGDDYLLVWDWLSSHVLYQIDLRTLINDFTQRHCSHEIETAGSQWQKAIAVSKILAVESTSSQSQVKDGDIRTGKPRIGMLKYSAMMESWEVDLGLQDVIGYVIDNAPQDDGAAEDEATRDGSESLLYNLEKLRKRYQE
ncbi:MAG: hypothetical protein Q9228_000574 [Teloschistes exilis]